MAPIMEVSLKVAATAMAVGVGFKVAEGLPPQALLGGILGGVLATACFVLKGMKDAIKKNKEDMKAFFKQNKEDMKAFSKFMLHDLKYSIKGSMKETEKEFEDFQKQYLKEHMKSLEVLVKDHVQPNLWKIEDRCDKAASKLEVMERRMEGLTYSIKDCSRHWGLLTFMAGYSWLLLVTVGY